MKKILSILFAAALLLAAFCTPSFAAKKALPVSSGINALRGQFTSAVAPAKGGRALDYEYYSPVGSNDGTKYPVVIFLHGIGHGSYVGSQLDDSDMPYWTSAELQARFTDGGAFVILPRCPENQVSFWGESYVEPLHALIDDFISRHKANVDTTRISISGSSQGGAMVWMMLEAYPEYFASAFPIASTETPTTSVLNASRDTAIWLLASKLDPVVSYPLATLPLWNNVCRTNAHPENCRLSSFGTVYLPNGSRSSDNHHLAGVITYDLHTLSDGLYPEMTTENGLGQTVDLTAPNGLIRWISTVRSDFTGVAESSASSVNIVTKIVEAIRNFFLEIVHLVQMLLGL